MNFFLYKLVGISGPFNKPKKMQIFITMAILGNDEIKIAIFVYFFLLYFCSSMLQGK